MSVSFRGRKLLIATKHHKEAVIAPALEKSLGVRCIVSANFDTDTLGTFSGEVERVHDPLTTLKMKCLRAMKEYNCDLGVANEGSFGMHPAIPFVAADDELIMLIDKKAGLEIIARKLSTSTNFSGQPVHSLSNLRQFAVKAGFPAHRLILRRSQTDNRHIIKDMHSWESLFAAYRQLRSKFGQAYVETDMRAMHNPTRMQVISEATQALIEKVLSGCPKCAMPGFSISDVITGLPCDHCGIPTRSIAADIHACNHCGHTETRPPRHGKKMEDPMYCDQCNP